MAADHEATLKAMREKAEENARTCNADALLDRYTESVKALHYNAHGVDPTTLHMLGRDVDLWMAVEVLREEIKYRLQWYRLP